MAILLLVIFGSSGSAPLLGLSSDAYGNLPICCRRDGKHQCMMRMMEINQSDKQLSRISEKCPYGPWATVAVQRHFSVLPPNGAFYASVLSHPSNSAQTQARLRISFDRSRQKRGPPPSLSLHI